MTRKRSKLAAHGPGQHQKPNNSHPVPSENGEDPVTQYHLENLVYHVQALGRLSALEPVEECEADFNQVPQELPPELYFMLCLARIKREEERELRYNRRSGSAGTLFFLFILFWSGETLACLVSFCLASVVAWSYLQASRTKT